MTDEAAASEPESFEAGSFEAGSFEPGSFGAGSFGAGSCEAESLKPESFEAVVFDMDGVLTDSEGWWDEVRRDLAAQAGRPWPAEATAAMMGMSTPEWSRYLVETVGIGGTASEAARATIEAMAERYREHLPLLPGAIEAVRRMARARKVGLASSSPRVLIDTVLDRAGLADVVQVSVSTEEVAAGKPAPDGYARACELLGVDPGHAFAVEDSTNGILSAHAAGLVVIAAPTPFHPPRPEVAALAAATIGGLDELTEELLARLTPRAS